MRITTTLLAMALGLLLAGGVYAQDEKAESSAAKEAAGPAAVDELALQQSQLADKYARLEELMLKMASLEAASNPRRAALLTRAIEQSKERLTKTQLDSVAKLLNQQQLKRAVDGQTQVQTDLKALLQLLMSEDRSDRLKSEQARIREYIKEVERLIRLQKGLEGQNAAGGDAERLAKEQEGLAGRTGDLAQKIKDNEEGSSDENGDESKESDPSKSDEEKEKPSDGDKSESKDASGKKGDDSQSKDGSKSADGDEKSGEQKSGDKSEKSDESKDGDKSKDGQQDDKSKDDKSGDKTSGSEKSEDSKSKNSKSDENQPSEGQPSQSQSKPMKSSDQPQQGQPQQGQQQEGGSEQSEEEQASDQEQNPARQRIEQAQQRMQQAQKKLEEAKRKESAEDQRAAREELEKAKAELEEILRQMREEEIKRTLTALEQRFRKMLEMQLRVNEATTRLSQVAQENRSDQFVVEAGKLGFDERKIATEAQKALALLQEEGSSVAFPATVEQMHEDMQQVADRLGDTKVDDITIGIEEDIVAALEEMIEALQKAQQDMEKKQQQQQQQQQQGEQEQPLVDQIAELKMIKSLQLRVNKRTVRYAGLLEDEQDLIGQATSDDLVDALRKLSERQQEIFQITRDIVLGKNQ